MTDKELRDAAVVELSQTTVGWNKAKNYSPEKLATTHWGKALPLLGAISSANGAPRDAAIVYLKKTTRGYLPTATNWKLALAELAKIKEDSPPPPTGDWPWPVSFGTGPAGRENILPPRKGCFIGTTPDGITTSIATYYSQFEGMVGRKFDLEHRFLSERCSLDYQTGGDDSVQRTVERGHIPLISWDPTPRNGGEILRGDADNCLRSMGQSIAAQPHKILLRLYHEQNGVPSWMPWGNDLDGSKLSAEKFKAMFRRTVDKLREGGAFPKASIVWCPHEGYFHNGDSYDEDVDYPGDEYVDWVASDEYHWNPQWAGYKYGFAELSELLTHGGLATGVEQHFRGRKPYMLAETGAGPPGEAGNVAWLNNARTWIKSSCPGMHAFVYFDVDARRWGEVADWRMISTPGLRESFRAMALDPHFNTRV